MKLEIILLVFICLIAADKVLTMWSLNELSKTNPNYLQAEQNIAARWFFEHFGLLWGTVLFGLVTLCTLTGGYYLFSKVIDPIGVFWVIIAVYTYVILNNIVYLLKFSGIIQHG